MMVVEAINLWYAMMKPVHLKEKAGIEYLEGDEGDRELLRKGLRTFHCLRRELPTHRGEALDGTRNEFDLHRLVIDTRP